MPSLTINVPTRTGNAVCAQNGYDSATHGSKADFVRSLVVAYLNNEAADYEETQAAETAGKAKRADFDRSIGDQAS